MAITIHTTPGSYYSVNGDLIWVVSDIEKASDPVTYPSYKYIADVYVNGLNIARVKKVPLPSNKIGVFNLSDIIRNYIELAFNPVSGMRVQEFGVGEFFLNIQIKFGEDYDFVSYANLVNDSLRMFYNHYNGRLIGQNTILGDYTDKVASNRIATSDVQLADQYTFIPYFPTSDTPVDVVFTKYGTTIPNPITLEWGYTDTDPVNTPEGVTLQFSGSYASGLNNYTLNFTSTGNNKYLVVKEPVASPLKGEWYNTSLNYGTIPDSVFKPYKETGGYRYYYSRIPVILDATTFNMQFTNGLPNSGGGGYVATENFTETFTPTPIPVAEATFNYSLTEATTPDFIDADFDIKESGVSLEILYSTGSGIKNLGAGNAYSLEGFSVIASSATNPRLRMTVTKDGVTIFDESTPAIPAASLLKTGIAQPGSVYVVTVVTEDTADVVTPIDIDDDEPVAFGYGLQQLNISPQLVNSLTPGFLDSGTQYYTVGIGSQTLRLNLVCEPKYENFAIHFLNEYSGFDTKNFNKVSRKTISIDKAEFGKLPYTVDVSGNVSYSNGIVYNDTRSVYASQYTERMTLNSDFITDAEYTWLAQLIASPMVYIEMSGYLIPCVIKSNDYEYRKQINDKLTNLTIEIEFGDRFNTQFR